jgi:16S rRNA G966 N2-methylase RsmD
MRSRIEDLYLHELPSARTDVFYNTFAYPTKISPESIAVYIAAHTKPGDTVLDTFGGSGSTGLAALMCEHPTDRMLELVNKFNIDVTWGARNACIYEIGKYGAFASRIISNPPDTKAFSKAAKMLIKSAERGCGQLYATKDINSNSAIIRHVIWSDIMRCPKCNEEFTYYVGMVRHNPLKIDGNGICPFCGHLSRTDDFDNVTETVYDSILNKQITRRKRCPVRIYGQTGTEKWVRDANENDIRHLNEIEQMPYPSNIIPKQIEWGELYRSGYHYGITHLHHFYTKRNFMVMTELWEQTKTFEPAIRDALQLLLLSYNSSHATLMTRVVVKKNSKDFVLTGAQSGVLYISSLPVEKNIILGLKRKLNYFEQAFDYVNKCTGHVEVYNCSSERLKQADKTVDYVFTDPPFGDFIPYAEVNQINELWFDEVTDRANEIIISSSQNKSVTDYQKMMTQVFREISRVISDNAYVTVVFHASKATVWNALSAAYSEAGFAVKATAALNKEQASFKQVVSEGSVQGDPLILLAKGKIHQQHESTLSILDTAITSSGKHCENCIREIYSDYISRCLEKGLSVELDAKAAYAYISKKIGVQFFR